MRRKRTRKVNSKNRMSMLAIGMVVLLLFGILLVRSSTLKHQLTVYAAREEVLKEQLESEKARTDEIDEMKEYMQTDEYAEEIAREKLGLVKDNEIVFQEEESDGN